MTTICIKCGSADTQVGLADQVTCLNCGQLQDSQGNALNPGMDEATRAAALQRLAPRTQHPVGNLADLQRLGAQQAVDPDDDNFVLPEGVDPDKVPEHNVEAGAVVDTTVPATQPAEEPVDAAKAAAQAEASGPPRSS